MSIKDFLVRINLFKALNQREKQSLFLTSFIILVALLSFGIGRLSVVGNREPIKIDYDPSLVQEREEVSTKATETQTANVIQAIPNAGVVVGSSKSDKYHYLDCPGAKQISEKNKITFPSVAIAEASGYTLAKNCKP